MIKQETVKNIQQKLENTPPDRLPEAVDWTFHPYDANIRKMKCARFAKELTDMNKAADRGEYLFLILRESRLSWTENG